MFAAPRRWFNRAFYVPTCSLSYACNQLAAVQNLGQTKEQMKLHANNIDVSLYRLPIAPLGLQSWVSTIVCSLTSPSSSNSSTSRRLLLQESITRTCSCEVEYFDIYLTISAIVRDDRLHLKRFRALHIANLQLHKIWSSKAILDIQAHYPRFWPPLNDIYSVFLPLNFLLPLE